ncbi:MAG: tripartite tricarboxylate transporter permease [Mycobacterium sp.]
MTDIIHLLGTFGGSLGQVLGWPTFAYLLAGLALGFVVGILPGLGGGTTMALMLPFTFALDPLTAVVFLLAMHSTCATTGDVTAILFGVPGEASSAATVFDGHPMARMGQAGRAIGAALASSLVGAWLGAFCLALSIPIIRPMVLSFGPPEILLLTILALSCVASLSGGAVVKGLVMAALGLLLSTIGQDAGTAELRFTFGETYLFDGLAIVPVVIGLFAVPAIIQMMATGRQGDTATGVEVEDSWWEGVKDTFRHKWLVLRTSLIGMYIGVIPGVGGTSAQFIAYGHAQQTSKHPEKFGHGSIEGLLAAGSVNNSKEGGSLLPTVAFGVPGSGAMTILLGALLITGVQPGPEMLTTSLNVTFGMVWAIVIANLIVVLLCLLLIRQIAGLTKVRVALMVPILMTLISVGAFSEHYQMLDVATMIVFGLIAYAAERLRWPVAPLLIGLVLGTLGETNFFLSNSIYGGPSGWIERPIVLVLIVLTILGLLLPTYARRRQAQRAGAPTPASAIEESGQQRAFQMLFALGAGMIGVIALWQLAVAGLTKQATSFPAIVAVILVVLALVQIGQEGLQTVKARRRVVEPVSVTAGAGSTDPDSASSMSRLRELTEQAELDEQVTGGARDTWRAFGHAAIFFVLLWLLGFMVAVPLFALIYLLWVGREKLWIAAVTATSTWAFMYLLFVEFIPIPLFGGVLFGS